MDQGYKRIGLLDVRVLLVLQTPFGISRFPMFAPTECHEAAGFEVSMLLHIVHRIHRQKPSARETNRYCSQI